MSFELEGQFTYRGYPYWGRAHHNVHLNMCDAWEVKPTDVLLATFPKAGTTWTGEILRRLREHHPSYANDENAHLDSTQVPYLEMKRPGGKNGIEIRDELQTPRIMKTHLRYEFLQKKVEEGLKVIVVMREPKDNIVSMYNFYKVKSLGFPGDFHDFMYLVRNNKLIGGGNVWKWNLDWWERRHLPNICFVTYEDMQKDCVQVIHKFAKFLDIQIDDNIAETIAAQSSFDSMKKNVTTIMAMAKHPDGKLVLQPDELFRKGIVGDWVNFMTEEEAKFFDENTKKYYLPAQVPYYSPN